MRRLLERTVFFSEDYPEGDRVAAYQALGHVATLTPLGAPFRAHAVSYSLADLTVHLFDNVAHRFERSAADIARDGLDFILVQHLFEGEAFGTFDRRPMHADEGSLYVIDLARPVSVEEIRPVRLMLTVLLRPLAAAALGPLDRLHGRVVPRSEATPFTSHLHDVASRLEAMSKDEAREVADGLVASLTRVLAPAAPLPIDNRTSDRARARAFIEAHIAEPGLSSRQIAAALRISRTTLFRLFAFAGGVERFIFDRRLARVHAVLLDPEDRSTLTALAERHGFANPDHLGRLFRQAYGISPGALRRRR